MTSWAGRRIPMEPLLTYLNHTHTVLPLWALNVQDALWQGYLGNSAPLGISAMPSMHNARRPASGAGFGEFCQAGRMGARHPRAVRVPGPVHLGWHYAVDAYLAWLLTILVWYGVGPVARWWDIRAASHQFWGMIEAGRGYTGP